MGKYEAKTKTPLLSNVTYDVVERTTTYGLPALAAFYLTIAGVWGLPNPEGVSATILALVVLLRVFLGIAKSSYKNSDERFDGTLEMAQTENGVTVISNTGALGVQDLTRKGEVTLRVQDTTGLDISQ